LSKKRPASEDTASTITNVTSAAAEDAASARKRQRQQHRRVSLKAPIVMRDVTAFQKKHQVGEGTYGYVRSFVTSHLLFKR
jgi:hypothetical protein